MIYFSVCIHHVGVFMYVFSLTTTLISKCVHGCVCLCAYVCVCAWVGVCACTCVCVCIHMSGWGRWAKLTDNFDVDFRSVLPGRVADDDGVDPLVLPLRALDGEHTVAAGGLHVDPPVSGRHHLHRPGDTRQYLTLYLQYRHPL